MAYTETDTHGQSHLSLIASPNNEGYLWRKAHPGMCEDEGNPYRAGTSAAEAWLAGVLEADVEGRRTFVIDPNIWMRSV